MAVNDPTYKDLFYIKDATNNVIYQIKALSLKNAIQIALSGDVTGTAATDFHENVTINATIANGAVTHDKLATDSVQNDKIKDETIEFGKLAASATNGSIAEGTASKLATKVQVKEYVEGVLKGKGTYRGVQTVSTINSWQLSNLNNGDTVRCENSGTVTIDGHSIAVRAGEDLILWKYKDGGVDVGYWQSSDGEFKQLQTAVDTDTSSGAGRGGVTRTLKRLQQNENGDITATFDDIQEASTSQKGLVQLAGSVGATVSSENNKAASEKAVRSALDALETDIQSGYKPKQTAVTDPAASGGSYSFIASYSQDANGVSTVEKKTVPDASASTAGVGGAKGLMSAADKEKLNGITDGANKVEASQTNGNIKIDGAETTVYTHPTNGANVSKGDSTAQTPGFGGTFKVLSATVDSMGHTTSLGEHTVTIPDTAATPSTDGVGGSAGLMSAADKEKLDDLASGEATSDKDEVIAAALDDLDARMGAVEDAIKEENLGTRTADEIDSQVLKIGGDDVAASLASKVKSVKIGNSSGTELNNNGNVVIPLASSSVSGAMSSTDKQALDSLKTGAVTNVKYVANQSGGGGALKKTVNNADVTVLEFMTTAEAQQLWADAKAAALAT